MSARDGFRLWLRAFCAALLTTALPMAPRLAAEQDYGHWHPEGTPEHVHSLGAVLGAALELGPPALARAAPRVVATLEPGPLPLRGLELSKDQRARAPPERSAGVMEPSGWSSG